VIGVPCIGLASRIEQGNLEADDLYALLQDLIGPYRGRVDSVVLGCTHYPFVRRQIKHVLGDVQLFDGAEGTARRTRSLLQAGGLLRDESHQGSVTFRSSKEGADELRLYHELYDLDF
jgi:glutamate racemase